MDCIGGARKRKPKSVFVYCYVWFYSGADVVSVFVDYRAASYPRRKNTWYAYFYFVCLFLCLLIITCGGRKRKLNFC